MKIAVYSGNIPSTVFIENLIEGLSYAGFEILLFGKQTKNVSYDRNVKIYLTPEPGFKLIIFVIKELIVLLFKNSKLFFKSIKLIWNKKKDIKAFFRNAGVLLPLLNQPAEIFHIQWAKTIHRYPEILQLLDSKIVLSLRGAHINYSPLSDLHLAESYKKYFPEVDGFHAVSEAIANEATKYGADKNKIKVIHSSVKDELLNTDLKARSQNHVLEIISVGRFHWKKGYRYALDAMKSIVEKGIDVNYTIIAHGEVPEEILFMIDDYKLNDRVSIITGLTHNDLIQKLKNADVLLLPSVEEGIANVVLEAMAVGVPVITTDCGGMKEVVCEGINGFIIPTRDPASIVKKIIEFTNTSSELRQKIVHNAKQTIKNEFTKEKQIREFSYFYNQLVNN